jgi:hypothetical protein
MDNMKRITKKSWFGKKILGWGVRPVSLEGWLVTAVFLAVIGADMHYYRKTATGYSILAVIMIIFFVIARLTGDAPGSVIWDKLKNKSD